MRLMLFGLVVAAFAIWKGPRKIEDTAVAKREAIGLELLKQVRSLSGEER